MSFIDMAGYKFGKLTVIERAENSICSRTARWRCLCECGNYIVTFGTFLRNGHTTSCGCKRKLGQPRVHFIEDQYLANIFSGIKQRCYNPNKKKYQSYGGRGIEICDEWLIDSINFVSYVKTNLGHRPSASYSIDRIDVNGNYEPGNLRWATPSQQARNRRSAIQIKKCMPVAGRIKDTLISCLGILHGEK